MGKPKIKPKKNFFQNKPPQGKIPVDSLLDHMIEGQEYASLVDKMPKNLNMRDEIRRGIAEVEAVRNRPLLIYAGNVIKPTTDTPVSIVLSDDLPFGEMVDVLAPDIKAVDILICSPGGLAQQVSQFVNRL